MINSKLAIIPVYWRLLVPQPDSFVLLIFSSDRIVKDEGVCGGFVQASVNTIIYYIQ